MKIENIQDYNMVNAIKGLRYSKKSNEKSGSYDNALNVYVCDSDLELMKKCVLLGNGHDQFLRHIIVNFDITASLKFYKQLDKYHFLDCQSESTMHTITKRELSMSDFSNNIIYPISELNRLIREYNKETDLENKEMLFELLTDSLPSGFLQKRNVTTNYAQLRTIYFQRRNHKLADWHYFIDNLIKKLFLSDILITIEKEKEK